MPSFIRLHAIVKKILSVIVIILCFHYSNAQTKYGIIAGAGKSSLYKFPVPPQDFNGYSSTGSWWIGLKADHSLVPDQLSLFISSTYNTKGYKYSLHKETGTANTLQDSSFTQSVNYADLNINLRKKFMFGEESTNSFFFGTGPFINALIGGKEEVKASYFGGAVPPVNKTNSKLVTGTGPGKYNPLYFGWGFNLGFEITNFSVWLNMNIPLGNYYQDAQKAADHKIKTFGINASYTLFTHQKREKKEKKEKKEKTKIVAEDKPVTAVVKDTLIDTDGDGIIDKNDKCPTVKGSAKYQGCPVPDTDGDGINDDIDKCPTVAGIAANNGCPATDSVKLVRPDTTCFLVYFEPGKSILRSEAFETLSNVVRILKANPKLIAVFKGHTDNVGSVEANYNRSLLRASVCADYVASFYIDRNRLTIISLGNTMPAADLNDPLLQWKNRRVEVCIYEIKK